MTAKSTFTSKEYNHKNFLPRGPFCQQEELMQLRFQAKSLKLRRRKKSLSLLMGPNKTSFRGRGIDFEEVRKYQAGDDIRTIDWRVTARSGKPYTKLFQEERERPVLIATDQRQVMFFGSQHCFKSVTAAHVSALLAWSSFQNSDRVGSLVFNEDNQIETRPRCSRQAVLRQLHNIADYNNQLSVSEPTNANFKFFELLQDLRRITRPGTAVYIVSDFSGAEHELTQETIYQLSRHAEITAIHISDPLEATLPPNGQYVITNGFNRKSIFTGNKVLRARYESNYISNFNKLHTKFSRLGIPFITINTSDSPLQILQTFYGESKY